jgi:ubiquinone/menaquinone biosynthesis C-methylase UbiE
MDRYWDNPYDIATWKMENDLIDQHFKDCDLLLDLGVGFYPHVESTAGKHLVCVDVSSRSLMVARRVYQHFNEKMEYVCGDAMMLPFRNNVFEGIIAGGELICHMPGEAMIRESSRILKCGGKVVLSVAMKWCIDSFFAVLDSLIGNRLGYSMTRDETARFLKHIWRSSDVTWEVTPRLNLRVTLYTRSDIVRLISHAKMRIIQTRSLLLLSAVIPLPIQQNRNTGLTSTLAGRLLTVDRYLGRIPGLRWFAGNMYLVLE